MPIRSQPVRPFKIVYIYIYTHTDDRKAVQYDLNGITGCGLHGDSFFFNLSMQ